MSNLLQTTVRRAARAVQLRRAAVLLAMTAGTGISGGMLTAMPAHAADGYVYVWDNPGGAFWGGPWCRWYGDDADYRYNSNGCGNWNDRVSSAWNNGYSGSYPDVRFYEHIRSQNGGGASICLRNGYTWYTMPWGWDNRVSSHRWGWC